MSFTELWDVLACAGAGALGGSVWHVQWLLRLGRKAGGKEFRAIETGKYFRIRLWILSMSTGVVVGFAYWLWFIDVLGEPGSTPINKVAVMSLVTALAGEGVLAPLRKLSVFDI